MTKRIAILGGTGDLGSALARWLARGGHEIIIGSRDAAKAAAAAAQIAAEIPNARVTGTGLEDATRAGEFVILSVPYAVHAATLEQVRGALTGRILINAVVPLRPPKVGRVQLPAAGCAAVESQQQLGPEIKIVAAFHNVSAHAFHGTELPGCDVLVTSDDAESAQRVVELIEGGGLKAWFAGPLANAAASEALTSVLISINRRYGSKTAGLRISLNKTD
jgi:hypothetical protein